MNNIKPIRKQTKLSQEEFGKEIGVTQVAVSQWEQGVSNPSPQTAFAIIEAMKRRGIELTLDHIYTQPAKEAV